MTRSKNVNANILDAAHITVIVPSENIVLSTPTPNGRTDPSSRNSQEGLEVINKTRKVTKMVRL